MAIAESELLVRLAECHRPEVEAYRPDGEDVTGWLVVRCRACDGHTWKIRAPQDPPYECALWQEYRARVEWGT